MVNPVVEARAAEAAYWLREALRRNSGWLRRRRREEALRRYVAEVVKAHLAVMLAEPVLPAEEETEERLAAALEHAVREAAHPEVAAAAARYDAELAQVWRLGYKAELARRWAQWQAEPRPPRTTPELEAYEEQARAEWEALRQQREAERQQQAAQQPAERMGTDAEVERRRRLLEEYKAATGASEYAILQAAGRAHSCHKPEFRQWKHGELPADSETAKSLERFLAAKRPPSKPKRQTPTE
jgi:hypothetical protein